jgi:CheY-like chemotaxis protein
MEKTILILDDEKLQAEGIKLALSQLRPNYNFVSCSQENEMMNIIDELFFTLAIIDIRMDKYSYDGIDLINKIIEVNPFAKVLIISAFKEEYFMKLKPVLLTGKVVDVLEKKPISEWKDELAQIIDDYYDSIDYDASGVNNALLYYYAEAKNESNILRKGEKFENFISFLFQSMGYKDIKKRVKDISLNEVDLIIRNETDDKFLDKFGKYIMVECKNKPNYNLSKNDFIIFESKIKKSNGLSSFGIIATTGTIAKTVYTEAARSSMSEIKILLLSNIEFEKLITASNKKEELKKIIDDQVKFT